METTQLKPGMLTYEDNPHPKIRKSQVEIVPSPRRGIIGWIIDKLFGVRMIAVNTLTLTKEQQERLKKQMAVGGTALYEQKLKHRGEVPAPTHVLTPEKKTSKKQKKE